jgi:uncharacterized protein YndB with AHSA1/START domain
MHVLVRTSIPIAASPETVFDVVSNSRNFPRFFHALGPIPGADRVELLPSSDGALERRYVHMSDGSRVEERDLEVDRPRRYRYRWLSRPKPPLHLLVRSAESDWRVEPAGEGTRLRWNYDFELTSRLAYPAALVFSKLFERWMIQGLARIKDADELRVS